MKKNRTVTKRSIAFGLTFVAVILLCLPFGAALAASSDFCPANPSDYAAGSDACMPIHIQSSGSEIAVAEASTKFQPGTQQVLETGRAKAAREGSVTIKVEVVRVDLASNHPTGIDWGEVTKNLTSKTFTMKAMDGNSLSPNVFSFEHDNTEAANSGSALLNILANYGKVLIEKAWEFPVIEGQPIYANVVENVPYFSQQTETKPGKAPVQTTIEEYVPSGLKIKILPDIKPDSLAGDVFVDLTEVVSMHSTGGSQPATAPDTASTNMQASMGIKWGQNLLLTGFTIKRDSITAGIFGAPAKDSVGSEIAIILTATKDAAEPVSDGRTDTHQVEPGDNDESSCVNEYVSQITELQLFSPAIANAFLSLMGGGNYETCEIVSLIKDGEYNHDDAQGLSPTEEKKCVNNYVAQITALQQISPTTAKSFLSLMQSGQYSACEMLSFMKEKNKYPSILA